MNDKNIIKEFNELNHSHNKYNWFLNHCNIKTKQYISNRYSDSESMKESLLRILNNIEKRPECPICGGQSKFIGRQKHIFSVYCCNECKYKSINMVERHKIGCIKKYGVENISKTIQAKKKKEKTFLLHYGTKNNYGRPSVVNHIFESRKNNHTLNTSKPEEELYFYIKYKYPNVERQYKDIKRYPWHCDFYIPEFDCFIEYQGFQGHGTHPFNNNLLEDQAIIKKWQQRYDNGKHPLYKRMIEAWTIKDVEKRECAKRNNLNFHEFWNLEDAKKFIDSL